RSTGWSTVVFQSKGLIARSRTIIGVATLISLTAGRIGSRSLTDRGGIDAIQGALPELRLLSSTMASLLPHALTAEPGTQRHSRRTHRASPLLGRVVISTARDPKPALDGGTANSKAIMGPLSTRCIGENPDYGTQPPLSLQPLYEVSVKLQRYGR